jgi:ABC-type multidrug transport system fused ATPase/permease subunit
MVFVFKHEICFSKQTVKPEAPAIKAENRPAPNWPSNGLVVFRNVRMRYRDDLPVVLKGISFKVNPQEKIGIVGRTGSGKKLKTLQ